MLTTGYLRDGSPDDYGPIEALRELKPGRCPSVGEFGAGRQATVEGPHRGLAVVRGSTSSRKSSSSYGARTPSEKHSGTGVLQRRRQGAPLACRAVGRPSEGVAAQSIGIGRPHIVAAAEHRVRTSPNLVRTWGEQTITT
jgi:hypothetical protein